ncbi:MAG: hypothetical protein QXH07_06585 [Thermoplasmata archaeon]
MFVTNTFNIATCNPPTVATAITTTATVISISASLNIAPSIAPAISLSR